mmetsp:Transcript_24092/g.47019  ORF Transcript_24092/g.47019 Transcript_24092/m.47019 type:complete len:286 (-) Transcript_24092:644-1501(-)
MRVGYIEFNHRSKKHSLDGNFFSRDHETVTMLAKRVTCDGYTNYQDPLKDALVEFQKLPTPAMSPRSSMASSSSSSSFEDDNASSSSNSLNTAVTQILDKLIEGTRNRNNEENKENPINANSGDGDPNEEKKSSPSTTPPPLSWPNPSTSMNMNVAGEDGLDGFDNHQDQIENIDLLLQALSGRMQRAKATENKSYGGSPRRWSPSSGLTDVGDSDPAELAQWARNPSPYLPRTLDRTAQNTSGELAILRDISGSMNGLKAKWASTVITRLIEIAKKKLDESGVH